MTRAAYWISYILRHNGANHLRAMVYGVSVYQYFLLDVVFTLAVAVALTSFLLSRLARLLKGKHSREGASRDDATLTNGHCHSESLANGKHKRNGSLKSEKKLN